jgi:hypothetical protein
MALYPHAIQRHSTIRHPQRSETRGIVIHWTAGHKNGDLSTLDGPNVDCHFYVDKAGEVYQFLDTSSMAWHAFHTANCTCLGIEHEGFGEAWTSQQLEASAQLVAWLTKLYNVPVKHVDPHSNWHGIFGHVDLKGIDKNNHTDSVPKGTGWDAYLARITELAGNAALPPAPARGPANPASLQLVLRPKGKPQRAWEGWQNGQGALRWIAEHGLAGTTKASLSLDGKTWQGPTDVTTAAKELIGKFG